jgi:membrane protease YdiL (CAAX protease family)
MAIALCGYWHFIGRRARRDSPVSPRMWRMVLIAGGSMIVAGTMVLGLARVLLQSEPPSSDPAQLPLWTLIAGVLMTSAVAAVAEETGFRGYMQVPLERAYGPAVAIGITSSVFALIHLTHGPGILPLLPFILGAGVFYGVIAHVTGSILPSMAVHFTGDVVLFSVNSMRARGAGGGDLSPSLAIGIAVIAGALGVVACHRLAREAPAG